MNLVRGRIRVAKPLTFKLSSRDIQYDNQQFWAALDARGLTEGATGVRVFQFFSSRGEDAVLAESARPAAADRALTIRSPEWAAISIPAIAGLDAATSFDLVGLVPAAATGPAGGALQGDQPAQAGDVQFSSAPTISRPATADTQPANASNYVVLINDTLEATGLYDSRTKELMAGAPGDYSMLGQGSDDVLAISGDFSGGFLLSQTVRGIDMIVLRGGNSYRFIATDDLVEAGQTLTISAMPLGAGDHLVFDGSGETDGRFVFYGSGGSDSFVGGRGDDLIYGLGGADLLSGGGGRNTFTYTFSTESTGADFDTIGDFDGALDRIDLHTKVTGFGDAIEDGTLSRGSFDDDLSAALAGLGANQAIWFAPDGGDLAGTIFLVVDTNGIAGYQEGEDYVFAIGGSPLVDLTGSTDFFV